MTVIEKVRINLPTFIAVGAISVGLIDLLSAVLPARSDGLQDVASYVPLGLSDTASAVSGVVGLLLLMVGFGLLRRKRRAWRAAIGLTSVSLVLHVVKGVRVEAVLASALLLVLLLISRDKFDVHGDPRARVRVPVTVGAMLLGSIAIGYAVLLARAESIVGSPSVIDRLQTIVYGFVGVAGPVTYRNQRADDLVYVTLLILGVAIVLVAGYQLFRTPEPIAVLSEGDEQRLRILLHTRGDSDSLGYFSLRRDKAVVFSASGKAAVSYRVVSGVMLAVGDPLGDSEAWPGAIKAYLAEARRHAWRPAVMGCSELGAEVWARCADLRVLELGDEAVLHLDTFTLDGRSMRNVRQAVNKAERTGYVVAVRRLADVDHSERAEVVDCVDRWRTTDVERGFSMALGRIGDARDEECVLVTARQDGVLMGVLHFVPWGRDGLSLDLMRRMPTAESGVNELMIVAVARSAADFGVRRISLNFAVFRSALERGARIGAGPMTRAWRSTLLGMSRWWQIESLYRFNAKFSPEWAPRYLCYSSGRALPQVVLASLRAESFITRPYQIQLPLRGRATVAAPHLASPIE